MDSFVLLKLYFYASLICLAWQRKPVCLINTFSGGFPPRWGRQPPGGGNIWFCQIFPKNCMKLKKFGLEGRRRPKFYYVDPPLTFMELYIIRLPMYYYTLSPVQRSLVSRIPCMTMTRTLFSLEPITER